MIDWHSLVDDDDLKPDVEMNVLIILKRVVLEMLT